MKTRIMTLFARTPVHVGAGNSVGAVDSPVMRERHTKVPIIPGSSLKGVLADLWIDENEKTADGKTRRKTSSELRALFGSNDANDASAGQLLIGEARVLAFPVRSAKGAFAWITCPLALSRYKRDANVDFELPAEEIGENECLSTQDVRLGGDKVVLEEYALASKGETPADVLGVLKDLHDDDVWASLGERLVIVNDEIFSYFCEHACEVVTRIRVDDETGTVADGALFNQEQVPSETMFYAVVGAQKLKGGLEPEQALDKLDVKLSAVGKVIQVGGDETIGLGYCGVNFSKGGDQK